MAKGKRLQEKQKLSQGRDKNIRKVRKKGNRVITITTRGKKGRITENGVKQEQTSTGKKNEELYRREEGKEWKEKMAVKRKERKGAREVVKGRQRRGKRKRTKGKSSNSERKKRKEGRMMTGKGRKG